MAGEPAFKPLDVAKARSVGYSDAEIADEMAKRLNFDVNKARGYGYDDAAILGELTKRQQARLAPKPAPAPPPPPPRAPAPQPKPQEASWGSTLLSAARNLPASAYKAGAGLVDAVAHPVRTLDSVADVVVGGLDRGSQAVFGKDKTPPRPALRRADQAFGGLVGDYRQRYGSVPGFKHALADDPAGVGLDALVVAAPASRLARVPEVAERAAVGAKLGGVRGATQMLRAKSPVTGKVAEWNAPKGVDLRAVDLTRATKAAEALGLKTRPVVSDQRKQRLAAKLDQQFPGPVPKRWVIKSPSGQSEIVSPEKVRRLALEHARREGNFDKHYDAIMAWDGKSKARFGDITVSEEPFHKKAPADTTNPGPTEKMLGKEPGSIRKFFAPLERGFSPGTVDPVARRMGPIQRTILARHRLDAERAAAKMEKWQGAVGNAPVEDQRAIINAVESYSKGVEEAYREGSQDRARRLQGTFTEKDSAATSKFGINSVAPKYRDAVRSIRDVAQSYRQRIEETLKRNGAAGPSFVEDYYARMWKQSPKEVSVAMSRQGSGRNLKARSIPTYQEGLDAGLVPVHENPIDGMTAYVDNMSRFLATHELQSEMRASGLAKWVPKNSIPDGWVKLNGINTERELKPLTKEIEGLPVLTGTVPPRVLAAPESAARIYNNFVDGGLKNPVAKGVGKAFDAAAGIKLLGSAFHPVLVAGKAFSSDLAAGANHFLRGDLKRGAQYLIHAPFAPVLTPLEGRQMGQRLLAGESQMADIDQLFVDAGGRISGDQIYRSSMKPDFFKSMMRGTLGRDLKDAMKATVKGPLRERIGATVDLAGRGLDTISAPVFRYYVPAMKRGVFEREMTAMTAANPGWSEAEKLQAARQLLDNIDGRMGEMVRDNNFWSQTQMQVGRMIFLSPSWQIGDVRILTDAAKALPESAKTLAQGKGLDNRLAQAIGLVGSYFVMNGIANYLYTGEAPQGQDWIAFRTGGTNAKDGSPERATVPSVMKDFFGAVHDPMQEFVNKLHPMLKDSYQLANNKDWKGDPIVKPLDATVDPDASRFMELIDYFGKELAPIGLADNPNGNQSKIGAAGRFMGLRPAGAAYTNPERIEGVRRSIDNEAWLRKQRRDRKAAQ